MQVILKKSESKDGKLQAAEFRIQAMTDAELQMLKYLFTYKACAEASFAAYRLVIEQGVEDQPYKNHLMSAAAALSAGVNKLKLTDLPTTEYRMLENGEEIKRIPPEKIAETLAAFDTRTGEDNELYQLLADAKPDMSPDEVRAMIDAKLDALAGTDLVKRLKMHRISVSEFAQQASEDDVNRMKKDILETSTDPEKGRALINLLDLARTVASVQRDLKPQTSEGDRSTLH